MWQDTQRAPEPVDRPTRNRRLGLLLELMEKDSYPAVREIAWRGVRRVISGPAAAEVIRTREYDPAATPPARARSVTALRQVLGGVPTPAQALPMPLRGEDADRDLEIGE